LILEGVRTFGEGQWSRIAHKFLPHRHCGQIMQRYIEVLHPDAQDKLRLPWSLDDELLLLAKTVYTCVCGRGGGGLMI
jgi:hypothetical protein